MKYPITRPVVQLYRPAASLKVRPKTAGNYVQQCNYVYAEAHGLGLVMDIFIPEHTPNGLGIVDVISGGWFADRVQLNEHIGLGVFDALCAQGYTVFALSPGSVTKFTGLDMVRHVQEGIRHIKARAAHFNIDPDRLGLTGASAGGHIAALAALEVKPARPQSRDPFRHHDTRVNAVGLFFPPTDLLDFGGVPFDFIELEGASLGHLLFENGLHGHTPHEIEERMAQLSPARKSISDPPPFLLIHGDADPIVPVSQSHTLARALRAAHGSAELIIKPGGGHPWPDIRTEIELLADWFDRKLTNAAKHQA